MSYKNNRNSYNSYDNKGGRGGGGRGGGGRGYNNNNYNNNRGRDEGNYYRKERYSDSFNQKSSYKLDNPIPTERNNSSSYYQNNNNNNNNKQNNNFTERSPPPQKTAKQGNQMERPNQVIVPEAVTIVTQLVIGLGNFTEEDTFNSLGSNIVDVAELLIEQGDLTRYPEDISNLFVKCFCQLTLQAPAIATLLSVIARSLREFPELVLQKLISQFIISLKSGDILVAKNLFRVLACLASTNTILLQNDNNNTTNSPGFFELLSLLCDIAESEIFSLKKYTIPVEAAIFILTSSIPYYAQILYQFEKNNYEQDIKNSLLSRIITICRAVAPISIDENTISRSCSKYDVIGSHAIFHVSIEGTTPPNCANDSTSIYTPQTTSPQGAICWDSLWEICKVGDNILTSLIQSNGQSFTYENAPKCLLLTWQYPELEESLQKDISQSQSSENNDNTNILNSKLTLNIDLNEIKGVFSSTEFTILSGPISDCHLPALVKTNDSNLVIERQKFVSNSSSGYSSWIHLRFNIWDEEISSDSVKAITTLSLLELTTARDYYRSVLRFFEPFIRDDGTRVGSITLLYQHLTSIAQFFPEDSQMEYLLMETLLLLLLQIPSLNSNLIQRITLELCSKSNKIPPILVAITSALYELIPALDISSWRELSTYLSIHLANTNLQWPYWDYWSEEYTTIINSTEYKENGSLQKVFLELLIGQCSRLSLPERVANILPNSVHSIIPASESEYMPYYVNFSLESGRVYGNGSLSNVAEELMNKLNQREISNDSILKWLEQSHDGIDDAFQTEGWRLSLFIEGLLCRCTLSGGTISGMVGIIDRYRDILLDLILSYDDGYQILVQTLCSSLHHQCALLCILLDTLMRRGLLSPTAVVDVFVSSKYSNVGQLHIDYLYSNQWVWKFLELATDRCLDIIKAATSIQNNEAFKQLQQQQTDMDEESEKEKKENIKILIPDSISEAVDAAAESARELYTLLITKLLWQLNERHQYFVSIGQESPNSTITGVLTSLDPRLVSILSMLTRTMRVFHLTEKGLQLSAIQGTIVPSITSTSEVSKNLLILFKYDSSSLNENEIFNHVLSYLSGPGKRIWEEYVV